MTWSDRQIELLKDLHADGVEYSDIANRVSGIGPTKSRNACIGKIHRLGLASRTTPEKWARRGSQQGDRIILDYQPRYIRKCIARAEPPQRVLKNEPKPDKRYVLTELQAKKLGAEEIGASQCRWPIGNEDYEFCGHPKVPGKPYCAFHLDVARPKAEPKVKVPEPKPTRYTPTQSNLKEFEDA